MYPSSRLARSSSSPSISTEGLDCRRPSSPLRFIQSKLPSRRPSSPTVSSNLPTLSTSNISLSRPHLTSSISHIMFPPSSKMDEAFYKPHAHQISTRQAYQHTAFALDPRADEGIMTNTSHGTFDFEVNRKELSQEPPVAAFPPSQETQRAAKAALKAKRHMFRVLFAGSVNYKTDRGLLSKTKHEFFVLTNNYILRYKSSGRARAEVDLFNTQSRTDITIDRSRILVSLEHVYGVHATVAVENSFRVEYLHPDTKEPMFLQLTAETAKECSNWLYSLRKAVHSHLPAMETVTPGERLAAMNRIQKQKDLVDEPERMVMQKVLYKEKRVDKKDGVKEIFLPVLLAIGKFSVYILPVSGPGEDDYVKSIERDRHGLLAIQSLEYECKDDTVKLLIRQVNKAARQLVFVSTFCEQLLQHLRLAIECISTGTYSLRVPPYLENVKLRTVPAIAESSERHLDPDIQRFNTLLHAYCAALNLNKARFDYDIFGSTAGSKQFRLLPPNEIKESAPEYTKHELIAIFRSLRHNPVFREIKLSGHSLSELEAWTPTKDDGWTEVADGCPNNGNVLLNELFALLVNARVLRRIVLTNCSIGQTDSRISALMALGLAMSTGKCGVKRICVGNNKMTATDLRTLLDGIRTTHRALKEVDVHECSLSQEKIELLVQVLVDETPTQLQILDLSNNCSNIDGDLLDCLLRRAKRLAALRLRGMSELDLRPSLLQACRLRELDLGSIKFRETGVSVLCRWMQTPAFNNVERLYLDDCGLYACHLSQIMIAISHSGNRRVHLGVGNNPLTKEVQHIPKLMYAFMQGEGPFSMSLAKTEWEDTLFREFIDCLRDNQTLMYLDLSNIRIVDSISNDTVKMLMSLLARNKMLRELKLDYFSSKVHTGVNVGKAVIQILEGLKTNTTLERLGLEGLGMGDHGAIALSRIVQSNRMLQSISIDDNLITIAGFRALRQSIPGSSIIDLPKPRKDIRSQLKTLKSIISDSMQTEKETHWFIVHSTGKDSKNVKSRLEMQVQSRQTAEANYKRIVDVVDGLLGFVAKNRKLYELSKEQKQTSLHTQPASMLGDHDSVQPKARGRTASDSSAGLLPHMANVAGGVSRSSSVSSGWEGPNGAEHTRGGGLIYHPNETGHRPSDAFSSPSLQPTYLATPRSSDGSLNVPYYMQEVPSIPHVRRNTDTTTSSSPLANTPLDASAHASSISLDGLGEPTLRMMTRTTSDRHKYGLRKMKSSTSEMSGMVDRSQFKQDIHNPGYYVQQNQQWRSPVARHYLKQEQNAWPETEHQFSKSRRGLHMTIDKRH